jgi:plastocyanin
MAGPPPRFLPPTLTARAGDVTLYLTNKALGAHNLALDRVPPRFNLDVVTNVPLAASDVVPARTSAAFFVTGLPAGTYYFWCTIGPHAFEGMKGTLTLTP